MEPTIQRIENYYRQYVEMTSDVMLNINTDALINRVTALPQCRQILDELQLEYPITDDELDAMATEEIHKKKALFESRNASFYVAFCLQWYYYQKKHWHSTMNTYANKARWLFKKDTNEADLVRAFKMNVIRPILDYIVCQIEEHNDVLYYLERYKSRVERYTYSSLMDKNELGIQKDLSLYLFDQGLNFYQEPNFGHGRPDFVIDLECNGKPFVIEVKKKAKLSNDFVDTSLQQLKAYIGQFPSYGCLYIFTDDDEYANYHRRDGDNITIICVYTGGKTPSQLTSRKQYETTT